MVVAQAPAHIEQLTSPLHLTRSGGLPTFLTAHGVDLVADQQTKTRAALDYFASELAGGK